MFRRLMKNASASCVALALLACSSGGERIENSGTQSQPAKRGKDVAAFVDGVPILVEQVKALMDSAAQGEELSPEAALDTLIRSELLSQQARHRGMEQRTEVKDERDIALARLLLERRIGQDVTEGTIDRVKLRQFYEANKRKYVHGVQRVVHHVLVLKSSKNGSSSEPTSQLIAKEVKQALGGRATASQMKLVAEAMSEKYPGRVKREELPPCAADDTIFVKPFIDAVFALPGIGSVSEPFETSFGLHVALVVEERPPSNQTFESIEEQLALEVLPEEKKVQFRQLLDKLEKQEVVFIYDKVVEEWLTK
ncbi:MAG: peptidyl-prolyl cis-trans isomerase [Myxococcota bacterium]|jgi:hypothetical protein|nr:peptidyl-prolyl cis-trans isomerase [Myxococcota bacterium]